MSVGKDYIEIMSVDMVDGTPVLDVKPYVPYDIVPHDKVIEMAVVDECTGLPLRPASLKVPSWVHEADVPLRQVQFSEAAQRALSRMQEGQHFRHCTGSSDATSLIREVLRQDIRSSHQGRGAEGGSDRAKKEEEVLYECKLDAFVVKFRTFPKHIIVEEISF